MKLQLISDLHLNEYRRSGRQEPNFRVHPDADMVVIAGDIDEGLQGIEFARSLPIRSLYVLGNLEHYGLDIDEASMLTKMEALSTNARVLQNNSTIIGGVRFLGATLWTDFVAGGLSQVENMARAALAMKDYRLIRERNQPITPKTVLERHVETIEWMASVLSTPFAGPTVVVTHHAPHPNAIPSHRAGHRLQAAYVSRLTTLMASVDYWFHGHVHAASRYEVQGCRAFCNPFGSPDDHRYPYSVAQASMQYDPDLLIEVPTL